MPDMKLKRLSDEEIQASCYKISTCPHDGDCFTERDGTILGGNRIEFVQTQKLAQAQLDADNLKLQEILRQIKAEIEKRSCIARHVDIPDKRTKPFREISFLEADWQSFWQEYLGEERHEATSR